MLFANPRTTDTNLQLPSAFSNNSAEQDYTCPRFFTCEAQEW